MTGAFLRIVALTVTALVGFTLPSCGDNAKKALALLALLGGPRPAPEAPWPMWQHDTSHSGRSPYNGPTDPAAPVSVTLCCYGLFGSPAVGADSRVYLGSIRSGDYATLCDAFTNPTAGASGLLHGFNLGGAPQAGFPYDSSRGSVLATAIECAPYLPGDGSVIFGKDDGYMYRVSANGGLIWESPSDDPFNSLAPTDDNEQMIPSPLPGPGGSVYFLSHFADVYGPGPVADAVKAACPSVTCFKATATPWYSKLYALDINTGGRLWVFNPAADPASGGLPMVGWGTPALGADGSCIVGLMHTANVGYYVPTTGRVFAVGPDGNRRWVFPSGVDPLPYSLWASPVISPSGNVYIAASDYTYASGARLYSLTADGSQRWVYTLPENTVAASPALRADGVIIVATQNRHLTNPALRCGAVYALSDQGDHAALLWKYPAAGTVPGGFFSSPLVDASGRVYAANEPFPFVDGVHGTLLCIDSAGALVFSRELDGYVHGNLALGADGTLYVPQRRPPRLLLFK